MDETGFDDLARRMAEAATRRGVLRGGLAIAGAALGLRSTRHASAAIKRTYGQVCRKNGDCVSEKCAPPDATGRRRCGCADASECPPPSAGDQCQIAACFADGICGSVGNEGAPCDDENACTVNDACAPDGTCIGTPLDCSQFDGACVQGVCDEGNCVAQAVNDGVECTDDGRLDGTCSDGECVIEPFVGTPCDDGDPCTTNDVIGLDEVCRGTLIVCPNCQACSDGSCMPATIGAECEDENGRPGICDSNGVCTGG